MAIENGQGSDVAPVGRRRSTGCQKNLRKNVAGNRSDIGWQHGYEVPGNSRKVKCKYCGKEVTGGVYRFKHHLACTRKNVEACLAVPDDVRKQMLQMLVSLGEEAQKKNATPTLNDLGESFNDISDDGHKNMVEKRKGKELEDYFSLKKRSVSVTKKQSTINQMYRKEFREDVCMQIALFFYTSAIPFNCVRNPEFAKMCQMIGKYGIGFEPPSYHEIREKYLKKHVNNIMELIKEHKNIWKKYGCTVMSDGWTDRRRRSICNFLVNSLKGTIFLTSLDTSDASKTADYVFEMLDDIIEKVGEENVVQVVTDNAASYKLAGEKLMDKRKMLFWTPCAAHCIDLMLEDLEKKTKLHHDTISKGRKITNFIYGRAMLISIMKHFTKGRELVRPGATRFATNYICLGCLYDNRNALRSMFASSKWTYTKSSTTQDGRKVARMVLDGRFWANVNECLQAAYPIIKVLRRVDSDEEPAMGFIFEEMDRAKEKIKSNLKNERKRYEPIWKIVDERWEMQLHRPLHAAAYYLNPQFHYSPDFKSDREVTRGLYKVMERMLPYDEERDKVDLQLEEFKQARGLFGIPSAKAMRFRKTPAQWWESYGADTPEAQRFAIRILSLTCSSSGCERNWSAFEMVGIAILVHTKKRNKLLQGKMNDLVFVMSNMRLKNKKAQRLTHDVEEFSSGDEWVAGEEEDINLAQRNHHLPIPGSRDLEDEEVIHDDGDATIDDLEIPKEHATIDDLEIPKDDEEGMEDHFEFVDSTFVEGGMNFEA